MISTAKTVGWGQGHKELMRRLFGHVQFVGMMAQDPPVITNMVDLDPTVKDVYGFPVARITYSHHENDHAIAAYLFPRLQALFDQMRAETFRPVYPLVVTTSIPQTAKGSPRQRGPGRGFPDTAGGLVGSGSAA